MVTSTRFGNRWILVKFESTNIYLVQRLVGYVSLVFDSKLGLVWQADLIIIQNVCFCFFCNSVWNSEWGMSLAALFSVTIFVTFSYKRTTSRCLLERCSTFTVVSSQYRNGSIQKRRRLFWITHLPSWERSFSNTTRRSLPSALGYRKTVRWNETERILLDWRRSWDR